MSPDEYRVLIGEMKSVLKSRQMTYKDLAQYMGITEAGVKRIFSSRDGKISTLSKVCHVLGFSFIDLVSASKISKKRVTYFTEEQDRYLAENFHVYIFFNELVIRKKTIQQIQLEHGLSATEIERYLRKLERVNIIRKSSTERIVYLLQAPIGIKKEGLLRKVLYKHFTNSVVHKVLSEKVDTQKTKLLTREWMFSKESLAKLKQSMDELIANFDQIAAIEDRVLDPSVLIPLSLEIGMLQEISPYGSISNYRQS